MADHRQTTRTTTTTVTEFKLSTEPYHTNHAEIEKMLIAARHAYKDAFGKWPTDDQIKVKTGDYEIIFYFEQEISAGGTIKLPPVSPERQAGMSRAVKPIARDANGRSIEEGDTVERLGDPTPLTVSEVESRTGVVHFHTAEAPGLNQTEVSRNLIRTSVNRQGMVRICAPPPAVSDAAFDKKGYEVFARDRVMVAGEEQAGVDTVYEVVASWPNSVQLRHPTTREEFVLDANGVVKLLDGINRSGGVVKHASVEATKVHAVPFGYDTEQRRRAANPFAP